MTTQRYAHLSDDPLRTGLGKDVSIDCPGFAVGPTLFYCMNRPSISDKSLILLVSRTGFEPVTQ